MVGKLTAFAARTSRLTSFVMGAPSGLGRWQFSSSKLKKRTIVRTVCPSRAPIGPIELELFLFFYADVVGPVKSSRPTATF
jgi:hypothetical protein